ncbi:MAG TPA: M20/M25/M40 family metallo-hydrolase, partial [Kofleriaceae bacterium]|nr:M20/M25/M40 family metallo-hydrolase [Kofleriaceae bacterium]
MLVLLLGSITAAFRSAPDDVPASVAADDFDLGRAIAHLRTIAAESHFIGTPAHDRVRDYILAEAARIPGVRAELQTVEASYRTWDPIAVATVSNVVARLPGSGAGRAVLVVAHYDSTPTGPGAADDGSAVAAMLEVLRLAASGPPPRNELVFLFSDAEEVGSMGAAGFVAKLSTEERARIATVLNFDARGNRGPVVMFETSRENGWLVEQWAATAPHPVGSSLISTAYALIPNDTDFSVFREAGLPGLNFAYFDGLEVYHTARESLGALDRTSVQHQGAQMLGLVRLLASADLTHVEAAPAVYFDVLGRFVVQYGAWLSWLLAAACLLGMTWLVARGVRSRRLRPMRCAAAFGLTLATVLAAALVARGTWAAVTWLEPRYTQIPGQLPWSPGYFAGVLLLAAAIVLRGSRLFARRIDPVEAAIGALVPWVALAVAMPFVLPGTSYFFQWPALCGLGLVAAMLRDDGRRRWLLPASVLVVVPTLLVVPFVRMLFAAFGMTGIALVVGLWALWLTLLAPYLRAALGAAQPWLARIAAVAGAVALVVAFAGRVFDRAHPTCDSLAYLVDADRGRAFWVSADARLDDWTAPTLGAAAHQQPIAQDFPDVFWDGYVAPAPLEGIAPKAPELIVRSDTRDGAVRHLSLRLVPRAPGSMLELQVTPASGLAVDVAGTRRAGDALGADRGRVLLQFWTPAAGADLALTVPAEAPVTL